MSQATNDLSVQSEEILLNIEGIPPTSSFWGCKGVILTFGTFDGVHRGHQAILQKVIERARELQLPSAALVFRPRPIEAVRSTSYPYLTAQDETVRLIKELGVEHVGVLKFTKELAEMRAGLFLPQLMLRLPICELWLGRDAIVGRGPEGQLRSVCQIGEQLGFGVEIFDPPNVTNKVDIHQHLFGVEDFNSITQNLRRQFKVPAYLTGASDVEELEDVRRFKVLTPDLLLIPPDGDYLVRVCPASFGGVYPRPSAISGFGVISVMRGMMPDVKPRLSLLAGPEPGWGESFVNIEFVKVIKLCPKQLWQAASEYREEKNMPISNHIHTALSSVEQQVSPEREELLRMFIRNGHLTTPQQF